MRESLKKLKLANAMVLIVANRLLKNLFFLIFEFLIYRLLLTYTWFDLIFKEAQIFLKREGPIHQNHDLNTLLKSQQWVSNLS